MTASHRRRPAGTGAPKGGTCSGPSRRPEYTGYRRRVMRRAAGLLATLILTSACGQVAGTSATAGSDCEPDVPFTSGQPTPTCPPQAPAPAETALNMAITCHVFYRSAVTKAVDKGEDVTLDKDRDVVRVDRALLQFEARYDDSPYESRSLNINVSEHDRGVLHHLYQMHREALPVNEFVGGHGFTGLLGYSAAGAEMQYWCEAVPRGE